ncbi:PAAR domain-containing protein [Paraburkholderia antibiotica]|uniref:PAAR domain-containing protein n=1 Tax=Paraburkholderia antibiotica TaxID=2728839 RepID=A0A7Y0FGY3_9BURK|nr:PAAR domain-containing protein [Paraburkholderia antibiotica]NML35509.1 PAAR domain-containing protein [Paraburkholderia antibiotica]
MTSIACVGDSTTHGGFIITGSDTMNVKGRKVARRGDLVSCPIEGHGVNPIIEGTDMIMDNGVPVALHGHRCACGCRLIALGADVTVE